MSQREDADSGRRISTILLIALFALLLLAIADVAVKYFLFTIVLRFIGIIAVVIIVLAAFGILAARSK